MAAARTASNFALWTTNTTASPNCAMSSLGSANFGFAFAGWRDVGTTTISSASWNGSAMTQVGSAFVRAGPRMVIDLWRIDNPTAGNVIFTASGALGGAGNDGVVYAHACSGVDLTTRFGTAVDFDAVAPFDSLDANVPTVGANDIVFDFALVNETVSQLDADPGQTPYGLAAASSVANANSSSKTGTGTVAMGWFYQPGSAANAMLRAIRVIGTAGSAGSLLTHPRGMGGGIQGLQGGMNS